MIEDAFTQSDYAISITDPKGHLLEVNDAYLKLYKFADASEVIGKSAGIIRSPLTPKGVHVEMWKTISTGQVWRGELTNRAKDGADVFIHLTISPIRRKGGIVGYMGFSLDRAQQVILERQLFHANKLVVLGTLGAGLAHELNNPLASILLDAEFLLDLHEHPREPMNHAAALEAAKSVIRGSERMRRVLEHLLLYAKKDMGGANSTLSARQLIEDSLLFVEKQLKSRGIEVRIDARADAFLIGNRTQLESVFHNLISNSRDAFSTRAGEKFISISLARHSDDGLISVEFRDNAGGIPPEILPHIFEPFFTTKGGEGTGLGLSISKQIVTQHGGSITCESPGGETLFRILLPITKRTGGT